MENNIKDLQETFDYITEVILKEVNPEKLRMLRKQQQDIAEKIQGLIDNDKQK